MSNKEFILQEVLAFEGITRISKMLDQLIEGLQTLGLLKLMRLFPDRFIHLFTYKQLCASSVLESLCVPPNLDHDSHGTVTIKHLRRFIMEASEEGNQYNCM